jgi:hypothetical protein
MFFFIVSMLRNVPYTTLNIQQAKAVIINDFMCTSFASHFDIQNVCEVS